MQSLQELTPREGTLRKGTRKSVCAFDDMEEKTKETKVARVEVRGRDHTLLIMARIFVCIATWHKTNHFRIFRALLNFLIG